MTTAKTKRTSHSSDTLDEAAERALDYYLNPKPSEEAYGQASTAQLFMVAPDIDTEPCWPMCICWWNGQWIGWKVRRRADVSVAV
ncbi:hypothetical protein RGM2987_15185 [Pseudomonas sp. RGM2987]|nr:hypothetical protein [Pseudomonas sp. RGM2987]MCJ8205684.1 hypothetical protein [Pseudomonas sp. RGM2987]